AVLALVILLPQTHYPNTLAPTAPAVKAPRIAKTIEHPQPGPGKPNARVEIVRSIPHMGREHKTHASKTRPARVSLLANARLGMSRDDINPRHAENRYATDRVAEAVPSEENQVLVIATDVEPLPEPSAMSIESKDESTGVLVAYDFSRDETGMEQVMELTTNYVQGESGGN
ncbi:MAG: hypothetical protein NTU88_10930, partial [Armatimonadetes bacterium]|nr:hypothetical protein [Armatimonadota bacterium]